MHQSSWQRGEKKLQSVPLHVSLSSPPSPSARNWHHAPNGSASPGSHSKKSQDEPFPGSNAILKYYNIRKLVEYPSQVFHTVVMASAWESLLALVCSMKAAWPPLNTTKNMFPSSEFQGTGLKIQFPPSRAAVETTLKKLWE